MPQFKGREVFRERGVRPYSPNVTVAGVPLVTIALRRRNSDYFNENPQAVGVTAPLYTEPLVKTIPAGTLATLTQQLPTTTHWVLTLITKKEAEEMVKATVQANRNNDNRKNKIRRTPTMHDEQSPAWSPLLRMTDPKFTMRCTLWVIGIALILAVTTMPWSSYVGHSHWDRVNWIPFSDHPLLEIFGNVALFFPFGYFFPRARHDASPKFWALPIIIGGMLSTGVEFFQVYTHSRFPSTTDISANLLGVIFGLSLQRVNKEKL